MIHALRSLGSTYARRVVAARSWLVLESSVSPKVDSVSSARCDGVPATQSLKRSRPRGSRRLP